MTDSSSAARLSWVHKSNGRLVPFEPDHIARDLFTATERLGQPDAFLARELTDSVLHFLALETEGTIPTTAQIVDVVVKVVRELGHPHLAQAFAERGPAATAEPNPKPVGPVMTEVARLLETEVSPVQLTRRLGSATLAEYSLRTVYSRDLAAAHAGGLLTLGQLDAPLELAGRTLDPADISNLTERVLEIRHIAAEFAALDSPDYGLGDTAELDTAVAAMVRQARLGLAGTGLRLVANLNSAIPPPGAAELAEGPLFAAQAPLADVSRRLAVAEALREQLLALAGSLPAGNVRIDWHLADPDFASPRKDRLLRVAACAADGAPVAFVFDRPRRPVALAEGLDRQHPAVLMSIALHLPVLAVQGGAGARPNSFVSKLGSLVRLAFSAASQKRDFLRRHAALRPTLVGGFQLDRARVVLVPVGLEAVVRQLSGHGVAELARGASLVKEIIARLHETIQQEAKARCLEACLDSALDFTFGAPRPAEPIPLERVAGLTAWDAEILPRQQLKAAGNLQGETRRGTAAIVFSAETRPTAKSIADLLRAAWQQGDICRLRFVSLAAPRRLPALWEG